MSSIQIKKIGITKLATDCIVNAANSSLMEGGGVCGVIFEDAGPLKLQKACDVYGGCETGSAVITPGFNLKARYIIHAVGPRWAGGTHGEEQALYSCYQASMQLAMDNDCHSIAFPLISSGIFGYPKEDAWKVALRSVADFQKKHSSYQLDAIFAVISDEMYQMGNAILNDTNAASAAEAKGSAGIVRFHKTDEINGYLSNWYMRDFQLDGKTYCCVEQYMMEQKALLFGDFETAQQILQTKSQQKMKDLGRQAKGFVSEIWNGRKQLIVYRALLAKFAQNPDLLAMLLSTGDTIPVECARKDLVWGVGLGMDDPRADDVNEWKGQNLLGFALQAAREELKQRKKR